MAINLDGQSLDFLKEKLVKLKEIFPEAFTEEKVDWEKLKALLGEDINFHNERYNLNWAGKSEAFKVLQQRTSATLKPVRKESVNFDTTENVFIEGENLEVLKVLQKSYFGKIKMIYIDPPYNTGNDSFIYPDKFSETKDEYLKRIGEKDEEGYLLKEGFFRKNSKDSGHYHSNWLSMMYPRLYIARNLLRDDGVIFVSIDDNEVHNLKMVMNEIFGEENFLINLIWHRRQNADNRNENNASTDHEYILAYTKSNRFKLIGKDINLTKYKNPDNDPRGPWASIDLSGLATKYQRPNLHFDIIDPKTGNVYPPNPARGWSKSKTVIIRMIGNEEILFPSNPQGRPRQKKFLNELKKTITGFSSILESSKVGFTTNGTKDSDKIFEGRFFPFPKPKKLMEILISQSINDNDIILDFFAGSGTTAQAVMELNKEDGGNRKFILVQLPEKTDENSEAYKAKYFTIADICKERIRRVIGRMNERSEIRSHRKETKKQGELDLAKSTAEDIAPDVISSESSNEKTLDSGFKVFKLSPSNFKHWRSDVIENEEDLNKMIDLFDTQVKPDTQEENMLYELLLKSGFVLTEKIEPSSPDESGSAVSGWYSAADGKFAVVLHKVNQQIIDEIIKTKPQRCIILDDLFAGNDQLKTNTALQMKDAGVELVTV